MHWRFHANNAEKRESDGAFFLKKIVCAHDTPNHRNGATRKNIKKKWITTTKVCEYRWRPRRSQMGKPKRKAHTKVKWTAFVYTHLIFAQRQPYACGIAEQKRKKKFSIKKNCQFGRGDGTRRTTTTTKKKFLLFFFIHTTGIQSSHTFPSSAWRRSALTTTQWCAAKQTTIISMIFTRTRWMKKHRKIAAALCLRRFLCTWEMYSNMSERCWWRPECELREMVVLNCVFFSSSFQHALSS